MSAQYWLPCSCGQKVRVAIAQAGGDVGCACGKRLAVPTLRGIRQLEPAAETPVKTGPTWSRVHGAVFASGLVLISLGIALAAFNGYRYFQLRGYAVDRSAEVVEEYSGQLDKISPTEALDLWRKEILEEGLGEPHSPPWVTAKAHLERYSQRIGIGAGAIAIGLLAVISSLFIGRR
jgi:hypothetical protein